VTGGRRIDEKRYTDIKQELNIYNLREKGKNTSRTIWNVFQECQPIEFLGCCMTTTLKVDDIQVDTRRDGKISSFNPGIGKVPYL
jgi:hypothetical protein